MNDLLKNYGPMLVRYALVSLAGALMTHGAISAEQNSYLSSNIDALAGAIVLVATVLYGMWKRPSSSAMEAAKQIDKVVIPQMNADAARNNTIPSITIKTPMGLPDVVIPIKKAA